jgi:hypothetical protein
VKLERLRSTFTGIERFPSELVLCNLADTKRRNAHLGSLTVDADIARFDALVRELTNLEGGERCARVSGDEWLFLGADGRAFARAALEAYSLEQPYRAGWRCRATKDGEERSVVEVVTTTIARTVRLLGSVISSRGDLEPVATRLAEHVWQAQVATFTRLEEVAPPTSPRWACVADYPARALYCPFCAGLDLAWTDGDSAVYSGDATCKACHAELSFADAGSVLGPPSPGR